MKRLRFDLGMTDDSDDGGSVECLGQTFESDEGRRKFYLSLLAQKLNDPEFRRTSGFPKGTDEAILRMSDPPYFTACPNPFLDQFVRTHGRSYDHDEEYRREPFAVDVKVGKTDPLYRAHGYHTKVPHLAIVPSILHYTKPGDIVLDGFCGSGMTGVAAQWCGTAPAEYRRRLEAECKRDGREPPEWGARRVILCDLGPAATFIAANYNLPFHVNDFALTARRILDEVDDELGWMYKTLHTDGKTTGRIHYTVWSEVFTCPECTTNVIFFDESLDKTRKRIRRKFPCSFCGVILTKNRNLERVYSTTIDKADGSFWKRIRFVPTIISYSISTRTYQKRPSDSDIKQLEKIATLELPDLLPTNAFPIQQMYHGSRLAPKGFHRVHHLFLARPRQVLSRLWQKSNTEHDTSIRNSILFLFEQSITGLSVLNRHHVIGRANVNQQLSGVYYVPSVHEETSLNRNIIGKLHRLSKAFSKFRKIRDCAIISTGDCANIQIQSNSVDYIFTDPPFGENIFYSDLNFLVESWHRVHSNAEKEAIIDKKKEKDMMVYQHLMYRCFKEYHRVLKPGRWMTVVFSNSKNAIWRAIQEAIGTAGFVVADVRTLDKKQGSFRQVTSSAVKQDLVISAYKPTESLVNEFRLRSATGNSVWPFIREHLANLPVFVGRLDSGADIISERTPQMLHDRMIAFFVQRRVAVPISSTEFLAGLDERFPKRDGMYFLPGQTSEYDRRRTTVSELRQLTLFVRDEESAIQWIRQQLQARPQTFQDLQPRFMRQRKTWARHEKTIELAEMLDLNFLRYDGVGPVPSQIHSYLSTNYRFLRKLEKKDPLLQSMATNRWYVPDPRKVSDLEKLRLRTMLKEFQEYRTSRKRKIRQFRTEAVRAGFKQCYDVQDYRTITEVAAKLPDRVIQEDAKLLMYFDVAVMRLGND